MSAAAAEPSILLLQIRAPWHGAALRQEAACFRELCGVGEAALTAVNLVEHPRLRWADVEPYDVVMVGGAGSHSVTHEYAFTGPLAEVVRRLVDEGRPFLGSCWGHQFLAWALGGRVVTDKAREEVGSFTVHLTEPGRRDPLFAGLPASFPAHLGHHDLVVELPAGMVELARTAACPNQAIRVAGKPAYGTQFHLEMTSARMRERLKMYSAEYLPAADLDAELDRLLCPSPEAETLLGRFLTIAAGGMVSSIAESRPG